MRKIWSAPEFAHYPRVWHMSPVVDVGEFVFLSGVTGARPDNSVASDPETQFRDAFLFLRSNLRVAGLDFADVVDLTTYHVDLRRHIDTMVRVKDEFIFEPYPAWTAVGVIELWSETLLERQAVARRDAAT